MNYVRMGSSGLKLTEVTFGSALTIGTESVEQSYSDRMIDQAWNLGIRSFDLSNNYGSGEAERLVGNSLKRYNREEYVVSTKGSWPIGDTPYHKGLSRKHIMWAFEESLKRMGMDYVDIYYAHRYDPETPMEEIVRTFNHLIESGRVRYWATSEWPAEALEECHRTCERLNLEKPVIEQCIYSFAVRKTETNGVKDFCNRNGVGMLGFSPLCQGLLTGKYRNGIPEGSRAAKREQLGYDKTMNFYAQNKERIDGFISVCDEYGIRPVDAAIQWGIRKEIYPVLGASKPEQLTDTLSGLEASIPEELWTKLESI
ncbi:MAG: aldo/keto reductase family protein [Lachnospiraceae bacterium]|nr:aldo/keto reductase family protein [Clostridiales bacterium]MCR5331238.1 aldo/keto reductase family protein [Lachnospiraceae bacterium]